MSLQQYIRQVKPRDDSYVNHVDRVQNILTEAANPRNPKPGNATLFEEYVIDAWNQLLNDAKAEEKFTNTNFSSAEHQEFAPTAFKIARATQSTTKSTSKMIKMGKGNALSSDYTVAGGVDDTSKADIRTEDNKFRLSMKENKASQLLSGGKTDAIPVFKIAQKEYGETDDAMTKIETVFTDVLERIVPPKSAKDLIDTKHMTGSRKGKLGILDAAKDKRLRKKFPKEVNDFLDQVTFVDKKIKNDLNLKINNMFNNSLEFKKHFTYEAASGAGKFAEVEPVANSFLIFSSSNGSSVTQTFTGADSKPIVDLANKMKVRFRWKHGSKAVFAADIPASKELMNNEEFIHEQQTFENLLAEELNEGIVDVFRNVTSWLKRFVAKVVGFVKELAKKGLEYVFNFFGIELQSVTASW
jgi:hypothetical protein